MTIVVGSDLPGLLGALEQTLGSSQQLAVARDAQAISTLIKDEGKRIEALILSDTIIPRPTTDVATTLWELVSYVSRSRRPSIPTLLTVRDDMPLAVHKALHAEAQQTGGDLYLLPRHVRSLDQPEAQQAVAWVMEHLKLHSVRQQFIIFATSNAGGSGTTSTVLNMCLQLARLGLRALFVDQARNSLLVSKFPWEHADHNNLAGQAKEGGIEQHITRSRSGLDFLHVGQRVGQDGDAAMQRLDHMLDLLTPLNYDVICFDGIADWSSRPGVTALLARPDTSPFVVCPPGEKERTAALHALAALSAIDRGNGRTALDATMLFFIEGEQGQLVDVRSVRRDVLRQYPMVTDLGTLPRDPALLSVAAVRDESYSVFDISPQRLYCQTIRHATRQWIEAVGLPATWLTRSDPHERARRRSLWPFRQGSNAKVVTSERRGRQSVAQQDANSVQLSSGVVPFHSTPEQQRDEALQRARTALQAGAWSDATHALMLAAQARYDEVVRAAIDAALRDFPLVAAPIDEELTERATQIRTALANDDLQQAQALHDEPSSNILATRRRASHAIWQEVSAALSEMQAMVAACSTALAQANAFRQEGKLDRAVDLLRPFDAAALLPALARTLLTARCALLSERIEQRQQAAAQQHADMAELATVTAELEHFNDEHQPPVVRPLEEPQLVDGVTAASTSEPDVQGAQAEAPVRTDWLQAAVQHNRVRTRLRAAPESRE